MPWSTDTSTYYVHVSLILDRDNFASDVNEIDQNVVEQIRMLGEKVYWRR